MKYRVVVHGTPFEVEVHDTPEGPQARVLAPGRSLAPPLRPFTLASRQGPLAALVSDAGALTVSVARTIEESVYEIALPGSRPLRCEVEDERARLARARVHGPGGAEGGGTRTLRAVMPGIVMKVLVAVGATVGEKDAILVVEAMKMQNEIRAGSAGKIAKLHVKPGQSVSAGAPLVDLASGA